MLSFCVAFHLLTSGARHVPWQRTQTRFNRPSAPTVCDYCSTGDLYTYWQMIGHFSEDTVRVFAAELGCALGGYPTKTQAIKTNNSDLNRFFQKHCEVIKCAIKSSSMIWKFEKGFIITAQAIHASIYTVIFIWHIQISLKWCLGLFFN